MTSERLSIQERAPLFIIYVLVCYVVSGAATGRWIPLGTESGLWFVSAMGLFSFRLLSSPFFPRPKDSLAAATTGAFVLWTLDLRSATHQTPLEWFRWISLALLALVMLATLLAIVLGPTDGQARRRWRALARYCFGFSTELGRGEIVFTPPAIIGALGFGSEGSLSGLILASAWILIAVGKPLERLVGAYKEAQADKAAIRCDFVGAIERIDTPDLVRVALTDVAAWKPSSVLAAKLSDERHVHVLPLFHQVRDTGPLGTGLLVGAREPLRGLQGGEVVTAADAPDRKAVLRDLLGQESDASLVGFIVEGSHITSIRFEVASSTELRDGSVVWCRVRNDIVSYQIVNAHTAEEAFERNPHGTVVGTAVQLGIPKAETGFRRCDWVPEMNTPVFAPKPIIAKRPAAGFHVGQVPGTGTWIQIDFNALLTFHGAILGATGTGKTELALDIVKQGLDHGAKVVCVDFTQEYRRRLREQTPESLALAPEDGSRLAALVEGVETGEYAAGAEKKVLSDFLDSVRPTIKKQVHAFLEKEGPGLALFELEDIANTRSTLRTTELFLSQIFQWARRHRRAKQILVVLEEAHTVIPEWNLYHRDRSDTDAVVGRTAQIALQGRKYGVGLLLVSQRTALVSKTILSQCATVMAFSLVDKTSLDYLAGVFGQEHCEALPHLPKRHAIVGGPGIVCEHPLRVELPYDETKLHESEKLDAQESEAPEDWDDDDGVPF